MADASILTADPSIWPSILTGSITGILAIVGSWWTTKYSLDKSATTAKESAQEERDRHAHYLAVRVVCVLDPLAVACGKIIADEGFESPGGNIVPSDRDVPEFQYPDDVDWKSIDADLMYKILTLPNDLTTANDFANDVWGHQGSIDGFAEYKFQYAKIGLQAHDLAVEIRTKYKLKAADYGHDLRKWLHDNFVPEDQRRKASAAMISRFVENTLRKQHEKRAAEVLKNSTPPEESPQ